MKEIFYDWGGANVWLFHAINDIRAAWLDNFMLLGTALGDHKLFPFYLGLLALFALIATHMPDRDSGHYRARVTIWVSVIAVFSVAYVCNGMLIGYLKPLLDFPRPPLALPSGTVNVIGEPEYHHSLPSGHASFAMLLAASLWPALTRRWRYAAAFFVIWVGTSRVSLGMHFPADVLAGSLSSLAVVAFAHMTVQKLGRSVESRFRSSN